MMLNTPKNFTIAIENIAKEKKCYRVDLNCNNELENFYNKNGFYI